MDGSKQGLRERLAIKKSKSMLSGLMPLALVNFDVVAADTVLWESFSKGGASFSSGPRLTEDGPEFQWSQWALVPWAALAGGAQASSRLPPGAALSLLRSHFEQHGCEADASSILISESEPPMPAFSFNIGTWEPGSLTHLRIRQWAMAGPLAFLGSKASLCFSGLPEQKKYATMSTYSDPALTRDFCLPEFPSARARHVASLDGKSGVIEAALAVGMADSIFSLSEIAQLEAETGPALASRKPTL